MFKTVPSAIITYTALFVFISALLNIALSEGTEYIVRLLTIIHRLMIILPLIVGSLWGVTAYRNRR